MAIMTGLSGNEIYCLRKKNLDPGNLAIGNSVFSVGILGSLGALGRTIAGGEVEQITSIIHDGRHASFDRMMAWTDLHGAVGITGVTSELILHSGNVEFLSVGSCVHEPGRSPTHLEWSASADGQGLYCQLDSGFTPKKFVFGNVAYSIGLGGSIMGGLRGLGRGEVKEYSEVFNTTRHLALERITAEARSVGANSVVGINTSIIPFQGMQEMVMIGTASHHPMLPSEYEAVPVTSDMTNEEMWNMVHLGYMPLRLVLGVSVYSLGFVGGISALFKSFSRGEINELTTLIYDARENAIAHLMRDADQCGADDVVGIKTYVYQLGGGMIEFMAIGTAVKKMEGLTTVSENLPPQAIIRDQDTYINTAELAVGRDLNKGGGAK
ncbi:MAG: heavy metal-binding domain-containing protein [Armatimonadetes bacterium]|nr:heavy metal-binding domain-containing protein [Armatimonadota bacterium]